MRAPCPKQPRDPSRLPSSRCAPSSTGVVLGIVFGAANAYLGLRVGHDRVGLDPGRGDERWRVFRLFRSRGTILEANLSQTVGFGLDLARDRHDLHHPGAVPVGHGAALPAGRGALLPGRAARALRDDPAAAPADRGGARRAAVSRGHGLRRGAAGDDGDARARSGERLDLPRHGRGRRGSSSCSALAFLVPERARTSRCPCLPKAELALEVAPALLGVGFILGYRQSGVLRRGLARLFAGR